MSHEPPDPFRPTFSELEAEWSKACAERDSLRAQLAAANERAERAEARMRALYVVDCKACGGTHQLEQCANGLRERAETAERERDEWAKACLSAREQIEAVSQDRREALNNIERYEAEAYERAAQVAKTRAGKGWGLSDEQDVADEIAAAIRDLKPGGKP